MNREIEIKLKCGDKSKVINRIIALRGKLTGKSHITDSYYSKGKDMSNSNELIRIREKDGKSELTFKGKCKSKGNIWKRIELTTEFGDADAMKKILINLGLNFIMKNESVREYYFIDEVEIAFIDILAPAKLSFIEIEGSEEKIKNIVKNLGDSVEEVGEEYFKVLDDARKR